MKTYIMRVNEPAGMRKVQVRDNIHKDKSSPNSTPITRMEIPTPITTASYYPPNDYSFDRVNMEVHSLVFERVALLTTVWMEINRVGMDSYGYHILIKDFVDVPQGRSITELLEVRDGSPIDSLLDVQYYRDEIDVLRDRVRMLEGEIKAVKYERGDDDSYLERMGIL